ncbi:MAG: PA2779 family protein [Thermodesulfovibrionales bacterium]|nr:PA2779 family protein [Thermodesulfovibrionales bacterium]
MFKKTVACYLVIAMFIIGIAPRVEAAFVPSEVMKLTSTDRAQDLEKIQTVLEHKIVKQRLQDLGFTEEEIMSRLSQLSDQEIHNLAMQIDQLKVGKDALGVIIALLIIAILIVVLLQLMGHKVVITK